MICPHNFLVFFLLDKSWFCHKSLGLINSSKIHYLLALKGSLTLVEKLLSHTDLSLQIPVIQTQMGLHCYLMIPEFFSFGLWHMYSYSKPFCAPLKCSTSTLALSSQTAEKIISANGCKLILFVSVSSESGRKGAL